MPKKKALIVGISDYAGKAPRLESPEREIVRWRDLLMQHYEFTTPDIRLLYNDRARKEEILFRLDWLFRGAEAGDQLVFLFAGHGVRIRRRDVTSGEILDNMDEALLAYPGSPIDDLETMAIFDDDLFERFMNANVPADANVTFILDCCFAGGFNTRDLPRRPSLMSVQVPVDLQHRSCRGGFSDERCQRLERRRNVELGPRMPVIVNAAGELNLAVEIDIGDERRSLFSYHALNVLNDVPKSTYNELLAAIRDPIETYFPQHANLRGNLARRNREFLT